MIETDKLTHQPRQIEALLYNDDKYHGLIVFAGDLYRCIRIARAPLIVMAVLLSLLVFPTQIPELLLSYAKQKEPTLNGGKSAVVLTSFSCLFLVYSIELILAYMAIRPGDLLADRLRPVVLSFSGIAFLPLVAMSYKILIELPETIGGKLLKLNQPNEAELFEGSALWFALVYGAAYALAVLATTLMYVVLVDARKRPLQQRTMWLRLLILFKFAPLVAFFHFIVVLSWWLPGRESLIIHLGSFYFFFQFCNAWMVLFSLATMIADRRRVPVVSMFVSYWLIISYYAVNEHHMVRPVATDSKRISNGADWSEKWIASRITPDHLKGEPLIVYFVAAQGGGMYAAAHAATVLSTLSAESQVFAKGLFAISSVSGGSLGSSFFAAMKSGLVEAPATCDSSEFYWPRAQRALIGLARSDLLAPIVTAGLYADTIQQLIPRTKGAHWLETDRAEFFEKLIVKRFVELAAREGLPSVADYLGRGIRDSAMNEANDLVHIFNVTSVATGHRLYFSPFAIDEASVGRPGHREQRPLSDLNITVMRAASASARFPYIAPPAGIEVGGRTVWLVDGAYFENSGVASVLDAMNALQRVVDGMVRKKPEELSRFRVNMKLIVLTSEEPMDAERKLGFLEQLSPVRTLLATRSARGQDFIEQAFEERTPGSVKTVVLGDRAFRPALGWVLSDFTLDEVIRRSRVGVNALLDQGFVPRECSLRAP